MKVHRRRNPPSVRASLRCCCSLALASFDVMMVSRCPMVQGLIAAVCDIGLVVKLTRHAIFLHSLGPLTMNVFGSFGYSLVDFTMIVSHSGLLFGKSLGTRLQRRCREPHRQFGQTTFCEPDFLFTLKISHFRLCFQNRKQLSWQPET